MSLPTITMYDPILDALRVWKIRRVNPLTTLNENLSLWQKILMFILGTTAGGGVAQSFAPLIAFAVSVILLVMLIVFTKLLQERNPFARSLSVVFVASQFVLLHSAFTGVLTYAEARDFAFLALINVIIVVSVGLIMNARIGNENRKQSGFQTGICLVAGSAEILYPLTMSLPLEFVVFLATAVIVSLTFVAARNLSMKRIGLLSSLWTIITVLVLVFGP